MVANKIIRVNKENKLLKKSRCSIRLLSLGFLLLFLRLWLLLWLWLLFWLWFACLGFHEAETGATGALE
ncbi:unnamed protein product [Coffea canephora]|uniref:Uncharacterized protein n=1 Tax=Coffea canephora TaxID=49390 RepID=A0A068UBR4_COFCA|nr:unnamed protein product [Coffea canephora]